MSPSSGSDQPGGLAPGLALLLADQGQRRGAHPFLEDARSARTLSYRELQQIASEWAAVLPPVATNTIEVSDSGSVALLIDDPITFAAVYLSVIAAGHTAQPIDPAVPAGELRRALANAGPQLLITDLDTDWTASGDDLNCPVLRVDPSRRGAPDEIGADEIGADEIGAAEIGADETGARRTTPAGGMRLSTSGSTGAPKVVQLGEAQLLHVARQIAAHNELTATDRGFCSLPLFHINAEVVGLLATLVSGATLVLDRRFRRTDFWNLLAERRITWLNAVPAILAILARDPLPAPLAHLRFIRSASAPLPVSVRGRIEQALGVALVESYGMTEAASQITATPLHEPARPGSVGRPVGVDLLIRDSSARECPPGEVGSVWIRGPGVITGYLGGRSADRFDDAGWLHTGDLGRVDADGFLYLSGRADDVINRGGELIHPREIQEVLLNDSRVLEAVVVGRPDDILGAVPVAKVIANETCASAADQQQLVTDLEALCVSQLSRFKRPAQIEIVADLPRAATGKIRTAAVRELVRQTTGD